MTAREELYAAVMDGGYHSPARSERASALIDAYRAEVLREAAEEIRREADEADIPGSPASPDMIHGMKWAADWIEDDPDTP